MNEEMVRLYSDYNNLGKNVYFFTVLIGYITIFIGMFGFDANFLYYPGILVMGSGFAWLLQTKYCYFNNMLISIIYRIVLLSVIFYCLYKSTYLLSTPPNPNPLVYITFATIFMSCVNLLIGFVIALPFKLISFLNDGITSIDSLYLYDDRTLREPKNRYQQDNYENDIYYNYNEQQLEAALKIATMEENYLEVAVIKKHLKRFRADD